MQTNVMPTDGCFVTDVEPPIIDEYIFALILMPQEAIMVPSNGSKQQLL